MGATGFVPLKGKTVLQLNCEKVIHFYSPTAIVDLGQRYSISLLIARFTATVLGGWEI